MVEHLVLKLKWVQVVRIVVEVFLTLLGLEVVGHGIVTVQMDEVVNHVLLHI